MEKNKRHWGDRKDGRRVKHLPGMQGIMPHLWPHRTECEVYLHDSIDATELLRYLEQKNASHPEYKTTIFHCALTAMFRMVKERPVLNRFVQGRRTYERNHISIGFTCKRKFTDHSEEFLMVLTPAEEDTLDTISKKVIGDVREERSHEPSSAGGIDAVMSKLARIPRPILMLIARIIRWMDFFGRAPKAVTEGNTFYSTIMCSNLGSIQCPAIYHHLSNFGTNSIIVTLGVLRKEERLMPDGTREVRDILDIGATLDERIGDGFYFARSLKLIKYIFANPELLDRPLKEPSGFDYR